MTYGRHKNVTNLRTFGCYLVKYRLCNDMKYFLPLYNFFFPRNMSTVSLQHISSSYHYQLIPKQFKELLFITSEFSNVIIINILISLFFKFFGCNKKIISLKILLCPSFWFIASSYLILWNFFCLFLVLSIYSSFSYPLFLSSFYFLIKRRTINN